jgi:hypothetical protein
MRKAGAAPAFLLGRPFLFGRFVDAAVPATFFGDCEKISRRMQLFVTIRYYGSGRLVGPQTCVLLR